MRGAALSVAILAMLAGVAQAKPTMAFVNVARDHNLGNEAITRLRKAAAVRADVTELPALIGRLGTAAELNSATGLLKQAAEQFANFKHADALASVARARTLLKGLLPAAAAKHALSDAHVLIARVHAINGKTAKAVAEFRIAYQLRPSRAELDAGSYPPRIRRMYAGAVAKQKSDATPANVLGPAGYRMQDWPAAARGTWLRNAIRQTSEPATVLGLVGRAAKLGSTDELIIVRQNVSGSVEVARYDVAKASLGPWQSEAELAKALAPTIESPTTAVKRTNHTGQRTDLTATRGRRSRPWYRTTWGRGLMVGIGATLIGGAVVFALSQGNRSYTIEDWRWGQ